jgi:DNA-binding XRE family transcriptional regulator
MQPNPIPGQTNDARDRRYEAAVLARILWLHPTHLTERERLLSLFAEGAEVDPYERAIRDLVSVGLLRMEGESIPPTLAAIEAGEIPPMTDLTDRPWSQDPDAEEGLKARFGENVRLLRAHAHISQEELASRADVHRTQITFFESGQRVSRLGTVLKLAGALEVDLATLLDGIVLLLRGPG